MNRLLGLILVVVLGLSPAGAWGQTCEAWYQGGQELGGVGFGGNSVGGGIWSLASWDPDGPGPARARLVACGHFPVAGTTRSDKVAMWNGTSWLRVGSDVNFSSNWPTRVAVYNNQVVVAGSNLQTPDLAGFHSILRWDGATWQALGTGVDGAVNAMIVYNGELVVGGSFTMAGGATANRIARWNGSSWQALGTGISSGSSVNHMTLFNGDLIVGGAFTQAGGVAATSIARWNGSTWSSMNNTASTTVGPFATFNGQLHAASSTAVFRYTGTSWTQIAGTASGGSILSLESFSNQLYVGGTFTSFGGATGFRIARWNGTTWQEVANSGAVGANVRSLIVHNNELLAGGDMSAFGGVPNTMNVARWNGTSWRSTVEGVEQGFTIHALHSFNDEVVASGHFTRLGGTDVQNVARLDGSPWSAFGSGLNAITYSFLEHNGQLFAGGQFSASGVSHTGVARWDGQAWQAIGAAMGSATIRALTVYNGDIIAGGLFTTVGGVTMNRIARWDGAGWHPLGSGMNSDVNALTVYGGELIAGGQFTTAGGVTVNGIARWNGSAWQSLGAGMSLGAGTGTVHDLVLFGGNLLAGGAFSAAGGISVPSGVARWNGSSWQGFGTATIMGLGIRRLAVWNGQLVAGGTFDGGSLSNFRFIAKWDGTTWLALGTGLDGAVESMTVHGNQLFVGGRFATAGGVLSPRWAVYGLVPTTPPSFAAPPQGQEVGSGSTLTLHAYAATGIPGIRYQWYRNGVALINGWDGASPGGGFVTKSMGTVHDASRPILLVIKDCQPADAGMYQLRLTSPCGLSTDSLAASVTILGDDTCTPGCLP